MMKVNEIFYSLQGEGTHAGTASIFIRFCGCNLKCSFCDTDFAAGRFMTIDAIIDAIKEFPCKNVTLTGGEPTIQKKLPELIAALKAEGYYIAMETNGTNYAPEGVDWVTCSPKEEAFRLHEANEFKVVFEGLSKNYEAIYNSTRAERYYLQPCDTGDAFKNAIITEGAVNYVKEHPHWRLSLQQQKILKVR